MLLKKKNNQTNILVFIYYLLRLGSIVCWYSSKVISRHAVKKLTRNYVSHNLRCASKRILRCLKVNYTLNARKVKHWPKNRCYIIISNHLSILDLPLIDAVMPNHLRFLGKEFLFKLPILGHMLTKSENLSVSQSPHDNIEMIKKAKLLLEDDILLWIFAEGGISFSGKLLPFKAGAFSLAKTLNAIIIPATVVGTNTILPPGNWRALKPNQNATVYLEEPIDSADYSHKPIPELMKCAETSIADRLKSIART